MSPISLSFFAALFADCVIRVLAYIDTSGAEARQQERKDDRRHESYH
jgi:hypothetical protein